MDIVTHGMMGVVLAAPLAPFQPEAAAAFMVGSALPDADALSRLFGRRVFLKCHQTYTHSLPVIAVLAAGVHLAVHGVHPGGAGLGLGLGMALHSLLDWTNTYGIRLWAPFTRDRTCGEWVFFIDLPVLLACVAGLALVAREAARGLLPGPGLAVGFAGFLAAYMAVRFGLKRLARSSAPEDTAGLVPTAFLPWRFLGSARGPGRVRLFSLNALTGRVGEESEVPVLDDRFKAALEAVPEFRVMAGLSPLFHAIAADAQGDETVVTCRDLRTRSFGTRFGELKVRLGPGNSLRGVEWNV